KGRTARSVWTAEAGLCTAWSRIPEPLWAASHRPAIGRAAQYSARGRQTCWAGVVAMTTGAAGEPVPPAAAGEAGRARNPGRRVAGGAGGGGRAGLAGGRGGGWCGGGGCSEPAGGAGAGGGGCPAESLRGGGGCPRRCGQSSCRE